MSQKILSISISIYRRLLKAYPAPFHQVYGPAMVQLFRDCGREACRATYTLVNRNPFVIIEDNLGLSPERLRQLRRQEVLLHLPEADWIKGANLLAVLVTLNVAVLLWQPTRRYLEAYIRGSTRWSAVLRALSCLAGGYVVFRVVQFALILNLLFLGFVD